MKFGDHILDPPGKVQGQQQYDLFSCDVKPASYGLLNYLELKLIYKDKEILEITILPHLFSTAMTNVSWFF